MYQNTPSIRILDSFPEGSGQIGESHVHPRPQARPPFAARWFAMPVATPPYTPNAISI